MKLMRFSALVLSILLTVKVAFGSSTQESECSPIDLRAKVGPIRDQGNIGWCYANAAADLLSYEYKDQLGGKQASAMYVALNYTDTFMADIPIIGESFFEGGSSALALKSYAAKNDKVCLQSVEEKVLTNGLKDNKGHSIPLKQKLKELMLLKSTFDDYKKDPSKKLAYMRQWMKLKLNESYIFSMGDEKLLQLLTYSSERDFPHDVAGTNHRD